MVAHMVPMSVLSVAVPSARRNATKQPKHTTHRLDDPARGAHCVDAEAHVLEVIERVEDAEDVHPVLVVGWVIG